MVLGKESERTGSPFRGMGKKSEVGTLAGKQKSLFLDGCGSF